MNSQSGFTLIELVAVTAIIAIMLVFAVPLFQNPYAFDAERKALNQLTAKLESYKRKAVQEQKVYQMHFNFDREIIWVYDSSRQTEPLKDIEPDGFALPQELRLQDIEYTDGEKVSSGEAVISFSPEGYSEKVLIHLQNLQSDNISILVEPFQPAVRLRYAYEAFEN